MMRLDEIPYSLSLCQAIASHYGYDKITILSFCTFHILLSLWLMLLTTNITQHEKLIPQFDHIAYHCMLSFLNASSTEWPSPAQSPQHGHVRQSEPSSNLQNGRDTKRHASSMPGVKPSGAGLAGVCAAMPQHYVIQNSELEPA